MEVYNLKVRNTFNSINDDVEIKEIISVRDFIFNLKTRLAGMLDYECNLWQVFL